MAASIGLSRAIRDASPSWEPSRYSAPAAAKETAASSRRTQGKLKRMAASSQNQRAGFLAQSTKARNSRPSQKSAAAASIP